MNDAQKVLRPLKAIRARCLDCMCGQYSEVRLCPSTQCPLWPYRMGHRPEYKGSQAEESLENDDELSE